MAGYDYLTRQPINKQKLSVFLRDLSKDLNLNIKHMVEDNIIKKDKAIDKENKNYYKGKKKPKKKDIIIMNQIEKRKKEYIMDDSKYSTYLIDNLDYKDPFKLIGNLKTSEGLLKFKFLLLDKLWKKKKT